MVIEIERTRSLDTPFAPDQLYGAIYGGESNAHKFIITAMRDGAEATLSGTVTAKFLRADNVDVALTGTIEGGKACVTLGDECYAVPGRYKLAIFVTSGTETLCVYAAIGNSDRTAGSSTVDGGNIIPSVSDLIAQINAAVATIPASYTDLMAGVAGTYDASKTYAVGDYAWYNGVLYRCTTAISTAESWTAAHWSRAVLGDDVTDLKSAMDGEYVRVATEESFWQQGSLNVSNGNTVASSNRIRTGFIDISNDLICCENGFFFVIFGYDSDSTYKGLWDGTSFHKPAGFPSQYRFTKYDLYKVEADKCKIVLAKDSGDDIIPSEGTNFVYLKSTDATLTLSNKPADAMITGARLDSADDAIESLKNISAGNTDTVVFTEINGISELIQGKAINSSGEEIVNNSSFCTGFIELLNDKQRIVSTVTLVDSSASYYHYIFYYDAEKNYTGVRIGGSKKLTVESTEIPTGAVYIRISLTYTGIQNTTDYHLAISQITQIKGSPSTKWYILGDSISAGYYSMTRSMANAQGLTFDYVSPVETESGEETGSVWDDTLAHNYWGYANRWEMKRQLVGKARPGQGYYKEAPRTRSAPPVLMGKENLQGDLQTVYNRFTRAEKRRFWQSVMLKVQFDSAYHIVDILYVDVSN